jgi:hypothetical protein
MSISRFANVFGSCAYLFIFWKMLTSALGALGALVKEANKGSFVKNDTFQVFEELTTQLSMQYYDI